MLCHAGKRDHQKKKTAKVRTLSKPPRLLVEPLNLKVEILHVIEMVFKTKRSLSFRQEPAQLWSLVQIADSACVVQLWVY